MVFGYKNEALCQKVLANASAFNTMSRTNSFFLQEKLILSKIFACELNARLKKKVLEYLSDTSLKQEKELKFYLTDLPSKPGVWDEDIIEKLFESKFVNPGYMRSGMDWFKTWAYHRNGEKFYRKIINKHAHPEHKKTLNTLLNWSQQYKALYSNPSLPLQFGDGWHVDIFDGSRYLPTVSLKKPSVEISRKVGHHIHTITRHGPGPHRDINNYLGSKHVPAIGISIHPYPTTKSDLSKKNEMLVALDAALQSCTYRASLLRSTLDPRTHVAVAKKNGIVVGGFSFEKRGESLHIKYLCSSKRVYNIGTVLMYAAEEYARFVGLKRVYMHAAGSAKPFYFKQGYNYLSNESNMSPLQSYRSDSNNSNNSNNTATSKRRLLLPSGSNAKMRKYV